MPRTNPMFNDNPFKLGMLSPNCKGGLAVTTVPERWSGTWEDNLALARMSDAAGLEFILPVGRWKGHGGVSEFHNAALETLTFACGVLASTERIACFGTVHVPMIHPIVAAKQMATIDQIGRGRFGLNLLAGWNPVEFAMFGEDLREHDDRYAYAQEWLDVVRTVWSAEEPTDFHGQFFDLPGIHSRPGPFDGEPPLVNAGFSPRGRSFAVENCDYLFTSLIDLESGARDVQAAKTEARGMGRDVGVLATAWVVCRETEQDANDYFRHYAIDNADDEATEVLLELHGLAGTGFPADHHITFRERFTAGHGGYPLIGTPDQVADELVRVHEAGFDGLAFGFVNYLDELPYFRDEVLPRLEARGLRRPASAVEATA